VVLNLGPGIKFVADEDPLPLNLKAGAAFARGPFVLACDISKPRGFSSRISLGGEFIVAEALALRAGYRSDRSFATGVGFSWRALDVDYAFVPHDEIEDSHHFSATIRF
jgi:hypothetical protein